MFIMDEQSFTFILLFRVGVFKAGFFFFETLA